MFESVVLLKSLLRKSVSSTKTRRLDEDQTYNQALAFFKKATPVMGNIYIGSAFNACFPRRRYDFCINCAAGETASSMNSYDLYLKDTDNVVISDGQVDEMIDTFSQLYTREGNILFNCWMGSSRSVAMCLLCVGTLVYQDKPDLPSEELFDQLYQDFKKKRPTINMSCRLKDRVIEYFNRSKKKVKDKKKPY
tara:strand:- start:364 stop:942 length:579 start_codon:yes stop_codon:yes gene_type:complete